MARLTITNNPLNRVKCNNYQLNSIIGINTLKTQVILSLETDTERSTPDIIRDF